MRLIDLFDRQAELSPGAIAIKSDNSETSFQELRRKSEDLALQLVRAGARDGANVGICLERSPEMIAALIATIRAGCAYVPLDPNYPSERLAYMANDSRVRVVITQKKLTSLLPAGTPVICIDGGPGESEGIPSELKDGLGWSNEVSGSAVYVIYTSGSTGKPKGVVMGSRPLLNLLAWHQRELPTQGGETTLQFTSLSFDVSFQEIFTTLSAGGTLVMVSEGVRRDPERLWAHLRIHRVNRLFLPFVALNQLAEAAAGLQGDVPPLKDVITAGEQLRCTPAIRQLFRRLPGARLHNHYGPSETHVVTALTLPGDPSTWDEVPTIGKPISGVTIRILSESSQDAPPGETGELFLGGCCVGDGYFGNEGLTRERFVRLDDAGCSDPGGRYYRTGDMGRLRSDGEIEFLGRIDHQVKIRGYRVELSEIEVVLQSHPDIREAAVTVRRRGAENLISAHVVLRAAIATPAAIKEYVKARLPEYMCPAEVGILSRLPLTPSGKVDRSRLLPVNNEEVSPVLSGPPVRGTGTEDKIRAVWLQVLGIGSVGLDDNFFDSGGSSISAAQVQQLIRQTIDPQATVTEVFEFPTIRALARHIDFRKKSGEELTGIRDRVMRQQAAFRKRYQQAGHGDSAI
jgi:amino acid adenylation domain-containing protein